MQERLLLLIGDRLGQNVGVAGYRVEYRQALITIASPADFMFEPAGNRVQLPRVSVYVKGRCVIGMHGKRRAFAGLRRH